MRPFLGFIRACIEWAVYFTSFMFPRNKRVWVFIGWRSNKEREVFTENVKYLFLHVSQHEPSIRAIWIGQDNKVVEVLREAGFSAYYYKSLKGLWFTLNAKYIFVGALVQKHHWPLLGGSCLIQLWHGKSLKKTGYNSPYSLSRYNKFLTGNVFLKPHRFISMSPYFSRYVMSDFHVQPERILATGLPKHDPLFRVVPGAEIDIDQNLQQAILIARRKGPRRLILYAPTFRPSGVNPLTCISLEELNKLLADIGDQAVVMLHPKFSTKLWKPDFTLSNITFCESEGDAYPLFKQFDLLISDYSSLSIEFLMIGKPVVLYASDLEEFKKSMGIYDELWDAIPGPKAITQDALFEILRDKPLPNRGEESKTREILFEFFDGLSSARIAKEVIKDSGGL